MSIETQPLSSESTNFSQDSHRIEQKKINIVLDATMFDTFQLCPARYHYRFNLNKVSAGDKPMALDKGTLMHVGLEDYYRALKNGIPFRERLDMGKIAIRNQYVEDSDLEIEFFIQISDVFEEYCNHWRELDERMEILEIEKPFAYILHEDDSFRVVMIGKIDLFCNYHDGRFYYEKVPFDHKTYQRDYPVRRLNNQFCNYAYATQTPILFVNKIGLQKTIAVDVKHKRIPLSYDPVFLEQWKENLVRIVKEEYLTCVASGDWNMNLTSCDKFNRVCEFMEVCDSSGSEAKIYKLQSQFADAPKWDVSQSLGKKGLD